jgi:cysteinyl-tRNA synthetase
VQRTGVVTLDKELCPEFVTAMDDDLSTPLAVAALHNKVREGNAALDAGDDAAARTAAGCVRGMADVLGLDPLSPKWNESTSTDTGARQALVALVEHVLEERLRARKDRDFATADALRDRLKAAGIAVEDNPDGSQWTLRDD